MRLRRHKKYTPKFEYEEYKEPICECMKCHKKHLRRERRKVKPGGVSKFLCVLVCPKCGGESYTYEGDEIVRRRKKRD